MYQMHVEHLRLLYLFQIDLGAFAITICVPNGFRSKMYQKVWFSIFVETGDKFGVIITVVSALPSKKTVCFILKICGIQIWAYNYNGVCTSDPEML